MVLLCLELPCTRRFPCRTKCLHHGDHYVPARFTQLHHQSLDLPLLQQRSVATSQGECQEFDLALLNFCPTENIKQHLVGLKSTVGGQDSLGGANADRVEPRPHRRILFKKPVDGAAAAAAAAAPPAVAACDHQSIGGGSGGVGNRARSLPVILHYSH